MNRVVPRLMYIQTYIDNLQEQVTHLAHRGFSTDQAIEIIKLAHMVQDGEARDESLYDIGLALEELSTNLESRK